MQRTEQVSFDSPFLTKLRTYRKLRSVITYTADPGTELRAPSLPPKKDKQPQFVEPFITVKSSTDENGKDCKDRIDCIDLDLPARGSRRIELAFTRKLEEDGILPNYTVGGEPLTLKSDRLRDAVINDQVRDYIESQNHAKLAEKYPLAYSRGYWATRGPQNENCSVPKALIIETEAYDVQKKTAYYARKAGDVVQQISDSRTVYRTKPTTKIVRRTTLLLKVIAEKLNPDTDIFALVATEAMFALLAAEEGLPGRSGNFGLVPTKVELWGVPYGLNPQEEAITPRLCVDFGLA